MSGPASLSVRLVILNYNGADLLRECLPSIQAAAHAAARPVAVTVLDNQSTDDSREFVTGIFPEFDYVSAPENLVLCSFNAYLEAMEEDVAILLNNDLRVEPGFIEPLVALFEKDPGTFLAASKVMTFDGKNIDAAASRAGMRLGMFWCSARYPGYEQEIEKGSDTFSAGFGAFSRKKFLELGGYDRRFLPGTLEDVDLCYRAREAGYHLYYEPASVMYHKGQATFKKEVGAKQTAVLAYRNTFLFMWKNFTGTRFWLRHAALLPFRFLLELFRWNRDFFEGFRQALQRNGELRS